MRTPRKSPEKDAKSWRRQIYPQTRSGEWIRTKISIHRRTKTLNDDRNMFRKINRYYNKLHYE